MPTAVRTDPFSGKPILPTEPLRTPQARVLAALMPDDPTADVMDWPITNRAQLAVRAGYTAISGTVTRALNGIRAGSSSGDAHPGLLARGLIEELVLDVEGTTEVNYRATPAGVAVYQNHLARGNLPQLRDPKLCTNDRYKGSPA